VASLLRWSRGEENGLLGHIFGRVAELNWMWKEAMDEFSNQVSTKMVYMVLYIWSKMDCSHRELVLFSNQNYFILTMAQYV